MMTNQDSCRRGFSLIELVISMALMSVVLAGAFSALLEATRANETVRLVTGLNQNLRVGMDLMVRDLTQAGQGLPSGRVVGIPTGAGALPIRRPGPIGSAFTFDAAATNLAAVTVGAAIGPVVLGQPTDMITVLAADNAFDHVPLAALDDVSMRVVPAVDISGQPDVPGDNLRVGDLVMLTKQSMSVLVYVTAVNGQVVRFDEGDPLRLNQVGAADGTLAQYAASAPLEVNGPQCPQQAAQCVVPSVATRIRMISYYLEPPTGPQEASRLIRRLNAQPATVVAFGVEQFGITYDIVDGLLDPVDVAMTANDLNGTGACDGDPAVAPLVPCSPGQVRKVNVRLGVRSAAPLRRTGLFFRNVLSTQVSLRSLALVDRYS